MKKKKNSKRNGIKVISNLNNNIYFFDNDNFEDEEISNYLLLEDDSSKLNELKNNLDNLKYEDNNTNKTILLRSNNNKVSVYENKYSIKKENFINDNLIKKYCIYRKVDTNLVIQIIHCNEDIKKIVAIYINDIIFSLSNITDNFDRDAVTKITQNFHYDIDNKKIMVKNNEYSENDLSELLNKLKKNKFLYGFSTTKENVLFEHIRSVSFFRNYISHDKLKLNKSEEVEKELNRYIELKGKEFLNNNMFNINLICDLFNSNKEETALNYYKYVLNQEGKNLGISIKKLVERCINDYCPDLDEERMKKYHVLLKYFLFKYIKENNDLRNKYIELLRNSDYADKDKIYEDIVCEIPKDKIINIENICKKIDFKNKTRIHINNDILCNFGTKWTTFALNIYSLTKFLTIKETNELTSTIINKLLSIKDLITASLKMQINISNEIDVSSLIVPFDNISDTIKQLNIINSIKKFTSPKHSKSSIDYLKEGLSIFKHQYEDLDQLLKEESTNQNLKNLRIKYPIKNFVRNNVINTKFFNYIIRYSNPNKVSCILYKNPNLVKYLLSNLPKSQLDKYNNVNNLESIISNITLQSINDNLKKGNLDYTKYINLYLTCLYFLVKNINRINGYYYIALSFYARDYLLVNNIDPFKNKNEILNHYDYLLDLTSRSHINGKDKKLIDKTINNFKKINPNIFYGYRNIVSHCNIINILCKTKFPANFEYKNYFKIYHYCLQNELLKKYQNEFTTNIINDIKEYNKYSKNFLFILNAPLIYNYSRYKNITDENIFMRLYGEDE